MAPPVSSSITPDYAFLYFASELFSTDQREDGLALFQKGGSFKGDVFGQLWLMRHCPRGDNRFGEHAFFDSDQQSSTLEEKARAIQYALEPHRPEAEAIADLSTRIFSQLGLFVDPLEQPSPSRGKEMFFHTGGESSSAAQKIRAVDWTLRGNFTPLSRSHLCLHIASRLFLHNSEQTGFSVFNQTQKTLKNRVFEELWIIRGSPQGNPLYGEEAFLHTRGGFSTAKLKARAIQRLLWKENVDGEILGKLTDQVFLRLDKLRNFAVRVDHSYHLVGRNVPSQEQWKNAIDSAWSSESAPLPPAQIKPSRALPVNFGQGVFFTWANPNETVQVVDVGGQLQLEVYNREDLLTNIIALDKETSKITELCPGFPRYYFSSPIALNLLRDNRDSYVKGLSGRIFQQNDKSLQILKRDDQYGWSLFQTLPVVTSWEITSPTVTWNPISSRELLDLAIEVQQLKSNLYSECTGPLGPWEDYVIGYSSEGFRLTSVVLQKIRAVCQLDETQVVDRDNWAITLVSVGGYHSDPTAKRGHAEILVEGIKGGTPFSSRAHLTKKRGAEIKKPNTPFRSLRNYSRTWVVNRVAVQKMLDAVKNPVHFGLVPLTKSRHNCLTWAIMMIRFAGIQLPNKKGLATGPDNYIAQLSALPPREVLDGEYAVGEAGPAERNPLCELGFSKALTIEPPAS